MSKVLLVEDDARLGEQVVGHLKGAGFEPTRLRDGDESLRTPLAGYSLVILDLMLPGTYGLDVLKHIRKSGAVPVIVISARNVNHEKVRAFDLGADDYLTKPFWPEELIARVRARVRRPALEAAGAPPLVFGELAVDVEGRRAIVAGEPVRLSPVEFALLLALARRAGTAVARDWLAEDLVERGIASGERATLDVHVSNLRKKLGAASRRISTVWGFGYRLECPAEERPA